MPEGPRALLRRALEADDLQSIDTLIRGYPDLLNSSETCGGVTRARSLATAEHLVSLGADVAKAGEAWAEGFGTEDVVPEVARFLIDRGAALTVHAAAGIGLIDRLRDMLAADPQVAHAKGGDGCTPLHFARDIETARLLLDHGAQVDARDDDHDSTPAQWLIGRRPEVVRFLLERGATPDIFLAVALGDLTLMQSLIDADPRCPSYRIGKLSGFPPIGHKGRGGTIYQWTLAFNSYPHQIALLKGHQAVFDALYERTEVATRLLVSCLLARREEASAIAAHNPGLVASLPDADRELVARYCWETNTNYEAVKLMLDLGFPIAHPERSHGYTPLHNAAWAGSEDLVDLLIARGHPVDLRDPTYHATPLGWAVHCATVEKRHPDADYGRVAQSLIDAGCPFDDIHVPTGHPAIDAVLAPSKS